MTETDPALLAALSEIDQLRGHVTVLTQHSLALNNVCFGLATLLGDTDGKEPVELIPMDLVRRVQAWIELLEGKLTAINMAIEGPNQNCDSRDEKALTATGCFVYSALHKIKDIIDA